MNVLHVARMREGATPLDRTVAASELPDESEYRVVEPVALTATASRDKDRVQIVGTAATVLELACSRCLESYPMPVHAAFDLTYLPTGEDAAAAEEVEIAEQDATTAFYRDGVIDLAELLHEQLYLSLPLKPLCKEACLGLCPICGTNRNVTTCACNARWEDPRLAALKALLKDNDDA